MALLEILDRLYVFSFCEALHYDLRDSGVNVTVVSPASPGPSSWRWPASSPASTSAP